MPKQIWCLTLPPHLQAIFKLDSQWVCILHRQMMPSVILPCLLPGAQQLAGWILQDCTGCLSAEFCSVGPRLGNAPKCTQILLYQPSSPRANRRDFHLPDYLNLLQGGASLLWLLWPQFTTVGFIKVVTPVCQVGKVWIDSWKSLQDKERFCSLLLPDLVNLTWPLIMADLSNALYFKIEIATNLFLFFLLSSQEKYFD